MCMFVKHVAVLLHMACSEAQRSAALQVPPLSPRRSPGRGVAALAWKRYGDTEILTRQGLSQLGQVWGVWAARHCISSWVRGAARGAPRDRTAPVLGLSRICQNAIAAVITKTQQKLPRIESKF